MKHFYLITTIFAVGFTLLQTPPSLAEELSVEDAKDALEIPGTIDGIEVDVLNVNSGGIVTNISVGETGTMNINNSGQAQNTNISGGIVNIEQGGIAIETDITNNGTLNIKSDGLAQTVNVADTGTVNINGGTIIDADIVGGTIVVSSGTAQYIDISSNGSLQISAGGVASGVTVETGEISVDGGAIQSVNIQSSGSVNALNEASVQGATIFEGGELNISTTSSAENTTINNGGIMNVEVNSEANNTYLNSGGQLNLKTGATLNLVTINEGGIINAETASTIYNLVADAGAVLKLSDGVILSEGLTIHATANTTDSTLNFENLFAEGSNLNSLTLIGGVNSAFNKKVINNDTTTDKTLNLNNGSFVISDSGSSDTVQIDGWNQVNVIDSVLRLESNLELNGSEKNLSINTGSTLDVSGTLNNILNVTLSGNIINSGAIDMSGGSQIVGDILTVDGTYSGNNAAIVMDMDIGKGVADKIIINGDVLGKSTITLKSADDKSTSNKILLVQAPNNISGNIDSFSIWRSEASPFVWETLFENNSWYGYVANAGKPLIVPETAAYYGLIDNTFMQTASLGANLRNNIAISEYSKVPCRLAKGQKYSNRICRSARPKFTGWISPVYSSATIEAPYNYTSFVSGVDGGIDIISNGITKFGLLASYRNGVYNYDESGENYTLLGEAETTIDSYMGGAYIRADGRFWSVLLAGYAGMLDASVSTKDGVEADTSGMTYGATLDVNYIYKNISGLRIEPGVRVSYTSVKMDEISDNAGKIQEFEEASRTELEAGIRIAKRWEFPEARAEIFVKPSVIQIMNDCGEFELVEDMSLESAEDRTLMKIEAGMSFDMIKNWSASIAGSYSFGSDYTNSTANLSLIYNF